MTYAEKLRNPKWQKKRLKIMERDGWQCVICGDKERNLQVHHLVYSRHTEPWGYADGVYQTLCEKCHEERQELVDKLVDALRISLKDVPTRRLTRVAQNFCNIAMREMDGK